MIRKIKYIALSLLMFFSFTTLVFAAGVDTERLGSLEVKYQYDQVPMINTNARLYKIGTVDASGVYNFIGRYLTWTEPINHLTASEARELAKKLSDYISQENISPDYQAQTDTSGIVRFPEVQTGIYLIQIDTYEENHKRYQVSPTLLAIPQEGKENEFVYDVTADGKIEMTDLDPNHSGDNTVGSPSTYDEIYVYVAILFFSLLILIVLAYYIYNKKKGSQKK